MKAQDSDQRRSPRVSYRSLARLQVRPNDEGFEAEVHNLSSTGMFVIADHVPAAGARVHCHVFLGTEPWVLQGKVAWVRPDWRPNGTRAPAAGIEFVDLSERDSEALSRALASERPPTPESQLQKVEVQFDGLPAPVNARAEIGPEGLVLTTKLPFMRIGSEVRISYEMDGETHIRHGRLEGLSLGPSASDDVPRLLVEVSTPQRSSAAGNLDVPEPGRGHRTALPGMTPIAVVRDENEPESLPVPARITTPRPMAAVTADDSVHSATLPWGAPRPEDKLEETPTRKVATPPPAPRVPDGAALAAATPAPLPSLPPPEGWRAPPQPSAATDAEARGGDSEPESPDGDLTPTPVVPWDEQVLRAAAMEVPMVPSGRVPAPDTDPAFVALLSSEASAPAPTVAEDADTAPVVRPALVAKWTGAGLLLAALAWLWSAWSPRGARATRVGRDTVTSVEPHSGPRVVPLDEPPASPQARTEGTAPSLEDKASGATSRSIELPSWPFTLDIAGNTTTVWIPLRGSVEGARAYHLTAPAGVAATLPAAKPGRVAEGGPENGHHQIDELGLRQVWVEMREAGLHLRVLVTPGARVVQSQIEATGVRFVVERR